MTHATKSAPRMAAIPAATLALLVLAGCSSGRIGETWQCPLAEGGLCDSVAAADPAVPNVDPVHNRVLAEPLWRVRADERSPTPAMTPCAADCGEGFALFGWIARLFGGGGDDEESRAPASEAGAGADDESADRAAPGDRMAAAAGPPAENPSAPGDAAREAEPAASSTAPAGTTPRPAADTALLPAPGSGPTVCTHLPWGVLKGGIPLSRVL